FRLLGSEGIDNDDDGLVNEDGPGGYDPNRDWGWFWQPRHIQGGAYRYPFSIEENRLVADFIRQHPNIGGAQSYHNAGGMILRGPGAKSDAYPQSDVLVYDALGRKGEQMLPGYRYMNVAQDLYEVYGGEIDWLHCSQGIFAFTNELFTPFNYFREREEGRGYFGSSETQRRFNQLLLLNQGFVPWTETVHPQYGRVEVGGVKKSWQRQPPSFLLEEECHRNMAFTLYHADQLPQVSFQDVTARRLSAELLEITAIVENSRLIPTRSAINIRYKITPPDIVSIEGKDLEVVTAMLDHEPFFREATAQTRNPAQVTVDQIPGQGVVYVRWYVKDATQGRVKVKSVKGGEDEIEFNVELGR
ncbi:MAG: hypothetical protein KDA99_20465, partial [Planctomycetales bacterium]|nr:hypothetical protein [Planctomycetales bacterium]